MTIRSQSGFSLVQVIVAAGIMTVVMLAGMTFFGNQTKSNNFLEFQAKREQLRGSLLSQFLNQGDNCKCLFAGATEFSAAMGTPLLTGVVPTQIGRYDFVTPGVCATATVPAPFINNVGVDGMKTTAIEMKNIRNISGDYSGELHITIESTKEVLGPKTLLLKIPVSILTIPGTAGNVVFQSCSATGSGGGGGVALGTCPTGLLLAGYHPVTGDLVCEPPTYQ